ncbi:MAG: hypothetical protein KC418_24070, partial [Anaerolineales bacterium]|nr:hypothetical protein [Anaerolineales bacterium]
QVRLEFSDLPPGFVTGPAGDGSNTTVSFVTSPRCSVNLGVNVPAQFCQVQPPDIATTQFIVGGQSGVEVMSNTVLSFPYSAGMQRAAVQFYGPLPYDDPAYTTLAKTYQTGSVYGLAYQRESNTLFASAYMKRHAGFGPGDTGGIYQINRDTGQASLLANLNVIGGYAGSNPHPIGTNWQRENAASWDAVGKTAFGDMDISEDGKSLWLINLRDKRLYNVYVGIPPQQPTAANVTRYAVDVAPPQCNTGGPPNYDNLRHFGLGVHDGRIYVGSTCTAQTTGDPNDLYAYVSSFDPAHPENGFTLELGFPLNYPRGCVFNFQNNCSDAEWGPWTTSFSVNPHGSAIGYLAAYDPQPVLSNIEFDGAGHMFLGIRDRFGDLMGYYTQPPNGGQVRLNGDAAGDILVACQVNGTWTLE